MSNFRHIDMTDPGQAASGVRNIVSISDDGEIVTRDIQTGDVIQVILDECARLRQLTANMPPGSPANPDATGYIAAKVPIVIWQNWRREWASKYRDYFTWQTFEVMKLNSREFRRFKCVDWDIAVPNNVAGT